MTARMNIYKYLSTESGKAMLNLAKAQEGGEVEMSVLELVKLRTSQINGCAHCIDMHTKDARAMGETEQRLYGLNAWEEAPYYSDRERAALEWTEALTLISETHVPDELYDRMRAHFSEAELVTVTMTVVSTNAWNRVVQVFKVKAGSYKPQTVSAA
jgi:AhpD family alkylhydroperoxidase